MLLICVCVLSRMNVTNRLKQISAMHVFVGMCACVRVRVCVRVFAYVCMFVFAHIRVFVHLCVCFTKLYQLSAAYQTTGVSKIRL